MNWCWLWVVDEKCIILCHDTSIGNHMILSEVWNKNALVNFFID